MIMKATVIQTRPRNLLVRDLETGEEVSVHFQNAARFSAKDRISITYDGKMTRSIPPQITAISIQRLHPSNPSPPQSSPTEARVVVLRKGRDFLLVRGVRDNKQMRVNFSHANHFCAGQQIIIRYDTIKMSNPPEVNAIEITPVC